MPTRWTGRRPRGDPPSSWSGKAPATTYLRCGRRGRGDPAPGLLRGEAIGGMACPSSLPCCRGRNWGLSPDFEAESDRGQRVTAIVRILAHRPGRRAAPDREGGAAFFLRRDAPDRRSGLRSPRAPRRRRPLSVPPPPSPSGSREPSRRGRTSMPRIPNGNDPLPIVSAPAGLTGGSTSSVP